MTIIGWLDSTNDGASFIYEMEPLDMVNEGYYAMFT